MIRVALFGAAPDTPNMGVSALFNSVITGLSQLAHNVEFVVFDNGLGQRKTVWETAAGKKVPLLLFGARAGSRYYRHENLATMLFASRLGKLGALLNTGVKLIDSCDAVLDISGGDSFSDIYGRKRFNLIYRPKAIAINRRKPLILLPQTYGPYKDTRVRTLASSVLRKSTLAWARDEHSFQILKDLVGDTFNPERHLSGVDVAFGLEPSDAGHLIDETLESWLENNISEKKPLVGFNVSGLIFNQPEEAAKRYGLKADYGEIVIGFINKLMTQSSARIVLISHVMDQPGHYESDLEACQKVLKNIEEKYLDRVIISPINFNSSQVKWLISKMNWFCGTRMHSTIAGLSSGVPTASISYSDKTQGVFEICGQGEQVFDPRYLETLQIISELFKSFQNRNILRDALRIRIPVILKKIDFQIKSITDSVMGSKSI